MLQYQILISNGYLIKAMDLSIAIFSLVAMPWHGPKLALSHYGTGYKTPGLLVDMLVRKTGDNYAHCYYYTRSSYNDKVQHRNRIV